MLNIVKHYSKITTKYSHNNTHLFLSVMYSMLPGGRVWGVRVLLTATVTQLAWPNFRYGLTISSKGRCPPSWCITCWPFTHCQRDHVIYRTEQNRTEQNRTEQNRTEQNRTEQNRTEQNRTEQNRTEQNRTEQNRTSGSLIHYVTSKSTIC